MGGDGGNDGVIMRNQPQQNHPKNLNNQVILYTTPRPYDEDACFSSESYTIDYEIVNSTSKPVEVTIIFDVLDNFTIVPNSRNTKLIYNHSHMEQEKSDLIGFSAVISPFSRVVLGYAQRIDDYHIGAVQCSHHWKYQETGSTFNQLNVERYIDELQAVANNIPSHQDFQTRAVDAFCKQKELTFVDLEFPPSRHSIVPHTNTQALLDIPDIEWKRLDEILVVNKFTNLFAGKSMHPTNILQGSGMKCYGYLSALALIAECPVLVTTLFTATSQLYNLQGIYDLFLYKNGYPTIVRVDDFIPCAPGESNGPLYARCGNENSMWILIVEKALAKLFGSYIALQDEKMVNIVVTLTGAPCQQLCLQDSQFRPKVMCIIIYLMLILFKLNIITRL